MVPPPIPRPNLILSVWMDTMIRQTHRLPAKISTVALSGQRWQSRTTRKSFLGHGRTHYPPPSLDPGLGLGQSSSSVQAWQSEAATCQPKVRSQPHSGTLDSRLQDRVRHPKGSREMSGKEFPTNRITLIIYFLSARLPSLRVTVKIQYTVFKNLCN